MDGFCRSRGVGVAGEESRELYEDEEEEREGEGEGEGGEVILACLLSV